MSKGADDLDRLRAAIDAHERFAAEHGRRSPSEFLAEHEQLRDLLEPLLVQTRPPPQPHEASARVLGDFRLLAELGRGGMGVVYDAEQISLGRRVAVKVLPGNLALDPDRRSRFARESRLAASLDHPGIAKVISADADDGVIWFAMERIAGAPLDQVLNKTADTPSASMTGGLLESVVDAVAREHHVDGGRPVAAPDKSESTVWRAGYVETVVRIGAQIAEALQHAHEHGVIHRDVKPGNVLLRRDGSAVLTDFGLARELDAPSLSRTGDFLGTPSYCAPEQLSGERAATDHRTDVFALGVTLYELLTHRRPFEAPTTDEVRSRILTVEPPWPRRLNPKISSDLSSVLLKALEKDPNQRYQSAAAMAEDLRAVAVGRPVRAVSVRASERAWRWCRRNRWATAAIALLLGVVGLLLTVRAQLVHANSVHKKNTVRAGVALARAQDFHGALAVLMPLERQFPGAATEAALDEVFRRYPCLASYPLIDEPHELVSGAHFSADGHWVITRHERPDAPAEERCRLRLWRIPTPNAPAATLSSEWTSDPFSGAKKRDAVHVDPGRTVAWVKDALTVAVGGPGRETSDIDFTGRVIHELVQASVRGRFAVGLEEQVQLLDEDGRVERHWRVDRERWLERDSPHQLAILGDLLIRMRPGGPGSAWVMASDVPDANPVDIGVGYPLIDLDPDDPTRMVVTTDALITAWRSADGELKPDGRRENPLPSRVSHSRLDNDELELDEHHTYFARLGELPLRRSNMVAARFFVGEADRAREPYIVVIEDRVLRIWGMPEPRQLDTENGRAEIALFEPTARRLWCAGSETLTAWSVDAEGVESREDLEMPREFRDAVAEGMEPGFCGIAFDRGRAILACARGDARGRHLPGWIFVLPADELEGARSYRCSSEPCWITLSPDHRQLAVAGRNGGVELWTYDSERRELTGRVTLPSLAVNATRLSCVRYLGPRFLLASEGGFIGNRGILRWDLDDLDAPPVPVAPPEARRPLRCLAIWDDKLVATGGDDRIVRVMRVIQRAGGPELELKWHAKQGAAVFAVAFAERDGALILASADRHGEIRLWDAATGAERGLVQEASESEGERILSLDFSPDGRHLAASRSDGRVLLWDMDRPGRCLEGNRDCAEELRRLQAESR